jgi:cyclopropane fatty-acyl-phospholipid synthase-like methyltransferase
VTSDTSEGAQRVRRYYDNNAAAFERLGQGGASIHRTVWGPGASTSDAAIHYVDELILDALPDGVAQPTIVDLGCGLGASLLYLAARIDMNGEGITISPRQAARAAQLVTEAGVGGRVRCREGNYLALPDDLAGTADLTFSIEAFAHTPDADGYFREAARTLRPGGKLIICDDFLTSADPPKSPRAARWLEEFQTGWRVNSLLTIDQVRTLANAHGLVLVRDLDLTAHLDLRRPRDRWISVLLALGRVFRPTGEYWQSLVGGNALQWALIHGLLSYRFLELSQTDDPGEGRPDRD